MNKTARSAMPSPDPLSRVMVTGVGGAAGFGLIKTLRNRGISIVALDCDPLASGLHLPDVEPHLTLPASDARYFAQLSELAEATAATAFVPTLDEELMVLASRGDELWRLGLATWLPSPSTVEQCLDKLLFSKVLNKNGIPTPVTYLPDEIGSIESVSGLIVKPRTGRGSRDVYRCFTLKQASAVCELIPAPIVQPLLTGQEFTADCLRWGEGQSVCALRMRDRVKGGMSVAGTTFHDPRVLKAVRDAIDAVMFEGPCCVQGFITTDPQTPVYITEINPRFGGGIVLSEAAGADIVGRYIGVLAGKDVDRDEMRYASGVSMVRYSEEYFLTSATAREGSL
ncbi:ATP-grasp domain-containing protein [Streptomyces atratus]|uniref:ATP-grasp domain-containing protein n=1 Tax=Streptomyces atratus TaxID=1893 RepID=UPI0033D050CE